MLPGFAPQSALPFSFPKKAKSSSMREDLDQGSNSGNGTARGTSGNPQADEVECRWGGGGPPLACFTGWTEPEISQSVLHLVSVPWGPLHAEL